MRPTRGAQLCCKSFCENERLLKERNKSFRGENELLRELLEDICNEYKDEEDEEDTKKCHS
jgi:hypothetical protein